MSKRIFAAAWLLVLTGQAVAGGCEDSFQTVGDPRNGLFLSAQVKVPGLGVSSALGQMQQYAMDGDYEVGSELISGNAGELYFLQTSNNPAIVMHTMADKSGKVSLSTKLARGQKTDPQAVKTEFCSILAKLKTGQEGEDIAEAARQKTGVGRLIDAKADKLSAQIGGEVKRVLAPVASKGQLSKFLIGTGTSATSGEYAEAFAPLRAKYIGRKYRIDGQIYTVTRNTMDSGMEINYLVTPRRGLLGIRQDSSYNNLNFQIKCVLAKDQAKFFLTLSEGNMVTLVGTVTDMRPDGMELSACRQAE
jgi:hypothetical protein